VNNSSKAEAEAHETGIRTQTGGAKHSNAATAGVVRSPRFFWIQSAAMNKYLQELKDNGLVPLRLDNNTVLFVPPEKANRKYKDKYLKNAERARRMALNLR
jgi:hypothetical protein